MTTEKSTDMEVLTADRHKLSCSHFQTGHDDVVILSHGFYNNKDAYLFRKMAEDLSRHHDVLSFDFRGHGKSSGLFSFTSLETEDLRAVVSYAKSRAYRSIGVIGFSLGAAVAIIEGSSNEDIRSFIAVSSPYDFWKIDYRFWEKEMLEDLKLNLGAKGKGKGIRPGNPFLPKVRPIDIAEKIAPRPILFIHGRQDWLIHPAHSAKLYRKAKQPKKLTLVDRAGHAEKIYDANPEEFIKMCSDWFGETLKEEVAI